MHDPRSAVSVQVPAAHGDVLATDAALNDRFGLDRLQQRLELAAGEVFQMELQAVEASANQRKAQEALDDHLSALGYSTLMEGKFKDAKARDAALEQVYRESPDTARLRAVVEAARQKTERARAEHSRAEDHQRNLRCKGEIVAARLRAIAR